MCVRAYIRTHINMTQKNTQQRYQCCCVTGDRLDTLDKNHLRTPLVLPPATLSLSLLSSYSGHVLLVTRSSGGHLLYFSTLLTYIQQLFITLYRTEICKYGFNLISYWEKGGELVINICISFVFLITTKIKTRYKEMPTNYFLWFWNLWLFRQQWRCVRALTHKHVG